MGMSDPDDRLDRINDAVQNLVNLMYNERERSAIEIGASEPTVTAVVVAWESQIMTSEGVVAYDMSYTHSMGAMSTAPGLLAQTLAQVNHDLLSCDHGDR